MGVGGVCRCAGYPKYEHDEKGWWGEFHRKEKKRWEHQNLHHQSREGYLQVSFDSVSTIITYISLERLRTQNEAEKNPDYCLRQLPFCGLQRKARRNSLGTQAPASLLLSCQ